MGTIYETAANYEYHNEHKVLHRVGHQYFLAMHGTFIASELEC